jgi:UDP-glucose 4-epimerase
VVITGPMEECLPGDPDGVPASPYAAAETAAATYRRMFQALFNLPVVHLRVFMVYGPGAPRCFQAGTLRHPLPAARRVGSIE